MDPILDKMIDEVMATGQIPDITEADAEDVRFFGGGKGPEVIARVRENGDVYYMDTSSGRLLYIEKRFKDYVSDEREDGSTLAEKVLSLLRKHNIDRIQVSRQRVWELLGRMLNPDEHPFEDVVSLNLSLLYYIPQ